MIAEALVVAVETNPGTIGHILEAGSTSTAFSQRLAAIAAKAGASLIIVEPREQVRRALEIAFERNAHVIVTEPGKLVDQPLADIIVASGDRASIFCPMTMG